MLENLKNTILIEDKEYNITAVTADTAKATQAGLTLEPSFGDRTDLTTEERTLCTGNFDGSTSKTIKYVPATGGKFNGPVKIDNKYTALDDIEISDIVNYGQIQTVLTQLYGAPLYNWKKVNGELTLDSLKNTSGQPYRLNVVIGRTEDFNEFKAIYTEDEKIDEIIPESEGTPGLTYDLINDNAAYKVIKATPLEGVVKIPEKYNGKPVLEIEQEAFLDNTSITELYISNGITTIGQEAFAGCTNLKQITIPNSITDIGMSAFMGCSALAEIDLSRKLTEIPYNAFRLCTSLERVIIGSTTNNIGPGAFESCNALSDIFFAGTEAEWDISVSNPGEAYYNSTIHYKNKSDEFLPYLYICKDDESDTSLTSNKMYLILPGEDVVEISKGAVCLESPDRHNYGYYTYDTLAAVIAGINARLTALGSTALELPKVLPETNDVLIPDTLISNKILSISKPVSTVQTLQKQLTSITGQQPEKEEDVAEVTPAKRAIADEEDINIKTGYYRKAANKFTKNNTSANTITIVDTIPESGGSEGDICIVIPKQSQ